MVSTTLAEQPRHRMNVRYWKRSMAGMGRHTIAWKPTSGMGHQRTDIQVSWRSALALKADETIATSHPASYPLRTT